MSSAYLSLLMPFACRAHANHHSCRYRPSYPPEVFELLRSEGVTTDHLVADIGAGTGIFTRMLVDQGFRVVAVEPNDEMRKGTPARLPPLCSRTRSAQLSLGRSGRGIARG
jgi:SAM-dependent methyltransferase